MTSTVQTPSVMSKVSVLFPTLALTRSGSTGPAIAISASVNRLVREAPRQNVKTVYEERRTLSSDES